MVSAPLSETETSLTSPSRTMNMASAEISLREDRRVARVAPFGAKPCDTAKVSVGQTFEQLEGRGGNHGPQV